MPTLAAALFSVSFITALIPLCLYFWRGRLLKRLSGRITELETRLKELETMPRQNMAAGQPAAAGRDFKAMLAERFESMQERSADVSGKYRHVARLKRSGLGVDEIADILEVSSQEAEQMLLLAGSGGDGHSSRF